MTLSSTWAKSMCRMKCGINKEGGACSSALFVYSGDMYTFCVCCSALVFLALAFLLIAAFTAISVC